MKTFIKKTVLLLIGLTFISLANATVHTVTVNNFTFSPLSFTAIIGDTVQWIWGAGTHTTTSTTIPGGAAAWNSNINTSNTTFQYKVTVIGTYNYQCNFHVSMGMVGSFTVSSTSAVPVISKNANVFATVYPNPVTSILNIHLNNNPNNNVIRITDLRGRQLIKQLLINIDNNINVSTWRKGIYLFYIKNGEETMEGKFEVQ